MFAITGITGQVGGVVARVLLAAGHDVRAVVRDAGKADAWVAQGMTNPTPRIQMLDGFNQGWIEFAAGQAGSRKGSVPLDTVLRTLLERIA